MGDVRQVLVDVLRRMREVGDRTNPQTLEESRDCRSGASLVNDTEYPVTVAIKVNGI